VGQKLPQLFRSEKTVLAKKFRGDQFLRKVPRQVTALAQAGYGRRERDWPVKAAASFGFFPLNATAD